MLEACVPLNELRNGALIIAFLAGAASWWAWGRAPWLAYVLAGLAIWAVVAGMFSAVSWARVSREDGDSEAK